MRLITLCAPATLMPLMQKVAFTPHCRSRSSTLGVLTGSGPSSKVRATSLEPVAITVPNGPEPETFDRSELAVPVQFMTAGGLGLVEGLDVLGFTDGEGDGLGEMIAAGSTAMVDGDGTALGAERAPDDASEPHAASASVAVSTA